MTWRLGLTGGIASGKSTVARLFGARGVTVIDADQVARHVVQPGRPELDRIAETFGAGMLLADGNLNRPAMRQHVFADPAERHRLEAILHPSIRAELQARSDAADSAYVVWEVPILIEMGLHQQVDRVLVVDCPVATQLDRLMQRDGMDEAGARAMIDAQLPRAQRQAAADDLLVNDAEPQALAARVDELHQRYLALAGGCRGRAAGPE